MDYDSWGTATTHGESSSLLQVIRRVAVVVAYGHVILLPSNTAVS